MKLQVGILSMQKVINYGSFLQAYALKKILETFNTDVYFIDIKPGEILPGLPKKTVMDKKYKRAIKAICGGYLLMKIRSKWFRKNRDNKFKSKFFKLLGTHLCGPENYDVVVIGSDEVFNACNPAPWGFTTQLFGEGLPAKRIVSYAASFGHTTIEDIEKYAIGSRIKNALKNLSMISVRDENSYGIINQLIKKKPEVHFDPVLMYNWPEIEQAPPIKGGYIIVYSYRNRITPVERDMIIKFAKDNNKKLISLYEYTDWCDKNITPKTPFAVLSFFKHADYVVTDTFHGTIFSIINRKSFCTIVRDTNKNKLDYLLEMLHQTDRKVNSENDISRILTTPPDFTQTQSILEKKKEAAYAYLKTCLSF